MIDYTKRLPGQVRFIDRPDWSYEGVPVHFNDFGMRVPRLAPESSQLLTDGPHFTFDCLSATFFINSIYFVRKAVLEFRFSGDCVGQIESLSGYVASDLGTETYPVEQLAVRAELRASEIRFQVAGKCGEGVAWSFHSRKPQDWSPQFEIGFTVSDSNLPNFFERESLVDAYKRNRDTYLRGC
ncbi:MAG: hypothetical protein ACK6A8_07960 [Planctomycetota bacterium]